jgi:hypothetical protein
VIEVPPYFTGERDRTSAFLRRHGR